MNPSRDIRKTKHGAAAVPILTEWSRLANHGQGAWISYQFKLRGIKQKDVAARANVSQQMVARVSYGVRSSARVRKAIAQALGYESWQDLMAGKAGAAA